MTLLNDSLSAYLAPLLEKHHAGDAIIYDDLIHSWQAADLAAKKTDFDPAVGKQLRELHQSQLKAYEEAARAALKEQAESVTLPEIEENMEEDAYIAKILKDIEKPDWKVNEIVWQEAWEVPLRERASAALSGQEDEEDDDNEEMEEGEEEDNGKEQDAEGEVKPKPATKKVVAKKRTIATKAGKGLLKKKALSGGASKPTGVPGTPGQRAIRGRRARRGGRGGGAAGAAK